MYQKSLTLKGFKSFADKLRWFAGGLTVVTARVSPDVLWRNSLGSGRGRAQMLRQPAMEDVIFSGSSARAGGRCWWHAGSG